MKERIFQIVVAILLGLILPGTVIRLTTFSSKSNIGTEQVTPTPGQSAADGVWVLMTDGKTQWMRLDEYLVGVILAEMPTTYDHEAICAQAVAARTYALKRQESNRHSQGAVCTDARCCQAYIEVAQFLDGLGYAEDVEIANAAIVSTKNQVVTYDGQLIEATYYHCSGGYTENAMVVWGVDYPYLQAVESPGEEEMDGYYQCTFYSRADLEGLMKRQLPGSPSSWLGWQTYTPGKGVETMIFAGVTYSGVQLRSLLNLNSTIFSMQAENDGLWITTYGKGHRVGMSQSGAQVMAQQGYTWQEIIAHYYPGTRIDKMEDVR